MAYPQFFCLNMKRRCETCKHGKGVENHDHAKRKSVINIDIKLFSCKKIIETAIAYNILNYWSLQVNKPLSNGFYMIIQ